MKGTELQALDDFQKHIETIPVGTTREINGSTFLRISSLTSQENREIAYSKFMENPEKRLNIVCNDLESTFLDTEELGPACYSWYVCIGGKPIYSPPSSAILKCDLSSKLDKDDKDFILYKWKNDYIDKILSGYSENFRTKQFISFEKRLEECDKHILYRDSQDEILAHGYFQSLVQPVLNLRTTYVHQWVSRSSSKADRLFIHQDFFRHLFQERNVPGTGIALVNKKSLSHYSKNGFRPLFLSVSSA